MKSVGHREQFWYWVLQSVLLNNTSVGPDMSVLVIKKLYPLRFSLRSVNSFIQQAFIKFSSPHVRYFSLSLSPYIYSKYCGRHRKMRHESIATVQVSESLISAAAGGNRKSYKGRVKEQASILC